MTDAGKQTALFFGFVTAAMTYASAQATPIHPQPTASTTAQVTQLKDMAAKTALATRETQKKR